MRAVQVESGTFRDYKMMPINPFGSGKNHAFIDIWSILLLNDNGTFQGDILRHPV